MMKNFSKFATAVALSLVVGAAHAATISFSSVIPTTATDFNGTATLQKFDTNLGTLTGVLFELTGDTSVNYSLKNNSAVKHNYTVTGNATMDFTLLSANVVEVVPGGSVAVNNLAAGATSTGSFAGNASSSFDDSANKNLYKFNGTAFYNNGFTVVGQSGVLGPTPFNFDATQTGSATFKVTYTYTEAPPPPMAPEPASIALLTMGAVGMIARRRRAK